MDIDAFYSVVSGINFTLLGLWAVVPLHLLIALVAAIPPLGEALNGYLTPLQVEAILLCLLVFLGVQAAWVVAMAPKAVARTD